jgi:hypothetical protein
MREMLTDEMLEHLGERYVNRQIAERTGVPFYEYLRYPDVFDLEAERNQDRARVIGVLCLRDRRTGVVVSTVN